jgi:hypothetical protein
VPAQTAWHAELFLPKPVMAEGAQHRFNLSTEVGMHTHALLAQGAVQDFGEGSTEQKIHLEFRHLARERFGFERVKEHFLATDLLPVTAGQYQQSCRRIQKGRNATLPNWNAKSHNIIHCRPREGSQEPPEAETKLIFPGSPKVP